MRQESRIPLKSKPASRRGRQYLIGLPAVLALRQDDAADSWRSRSSTSSCPSHTNSSALEVDRVAAWRRIGPWPWRQTALLRAGVAVVARWSHVGTSSPRERQRRDQGGQQRAARRHELRRMDVIESLEGQGERQREMPVKMKTRKTESVR